MRTFCFVYLLSFIFTSSFSAEPEIITRRHFIKIVSACSLASIIPEPASYFSHHYQMHIDPKANLDTFGLQSFGSTVKGLLVKENYIPDEVLAEKVRWQIQDIIWKRLEPKTKTFKMTKVKSKIAIALGGDRYLYFEPEFGVRPLSAKENASGIRTVGKIEYVGHQKDPGMITYWIGSTPSKEFMVIRPDRSLNP
jgi:hypothetical protein